MIAFGVVYALVDPFTMEMRYVGQTRVSVESRLARHMAAYSLTDDTPRTKWILSLNGTRPTAVILAEAQSQQELDDLERSHIATIRANGVPLTNLNDGGKCDGMWRYQKHTPEHHEKIAQARRGIKCSAETLARMSAAHIGRRHTQEAKDKVRAAKLGKRLSDEHRAAISEAHKNSEKCIGRIAELADKSRGKPWPKARRRAYESKKSQGGTPK